jgi:hypothetical protein
MCNFLHCSYSTCSVVGTDSSVFSPVLFLFRRGTKFDTHTKQVTLYVVLKILLLHYYFSLLLVAVDI